jgi:RNA polymerase sigma-70 factor, ECF subfamily
VNDAELDRFRAGDPSLFRCLVEAESPRLLRYAAWLCADADDAADLVQETWITAYRMRATFRGASPLGSWLLSICRSHFLSSRRKTANRERLLTSQPPETAARPGAAVHAPADTLTWRRVAEAIADLPHRQRDVIMLRLADGLSTKACADRLNIPEGTVKSSLSRGLDALKPQLEDLRR